MKFKHLLTILFLLSSLAILAQGGYDSLEKQLEATKTQMMSGREKAARKNLDKALEMATKEKNDSLLCIVYGTMGEYAANIDADYYQAIRYIYKGIELAQQNRYRQQYGLLLSQLANTYYLKRDKSGLKYALESYELGCELNDTFLIYSGAIQSAYMYFLNKQHTQSMAYAQESETLMKQNGFNDQAHTFNLLGQLLYEQSNYPQAIEYYQKAMKDKQASQTSSVVYAHLGYARVLMKQQKYAEAITSLKQGIAISQARTNAVHRNELYETLSLCYERLHQYQNALNAYKYFRLANDSLFSEDKERDLNEIRYQYDSERHKNQIKQSKLEMLEKEQRLQQLSFILAIIVIVLILLYYLYSRKNKLYLRIVMQHQDAIKRETELNRRIEDLKKQENTSSTKYASSSLSDEKSSALFQQLEKTMKEDKIYQDKTLNKDKVAELLGTNRTYLSRIINEQAQTSFTHYVNRFRIEEAIRTLSDPANDIPLKALASELGFNSISTFYNLFQSSVGMTPSQYRSKVHELEKLR